MLKRLTAYLLIGALVCSSFQWVLVYAGFELNHKYIAESLCVNRNKPWLHCNGKCYFMKKLKQAEEKEKSEASQTQKSLIQQVFFTKTAAVKFHSYLVRVMHVPDGKVNLPQVSYPVLRPPRVG